MTTAEREARIRAFLATAPPLTPQERYLQLLSSAYGNAKIDEPTITREEVAAAIRRLIGPPPG